MQANTPSITEHFRKAAFAAGLSMPDAELVASANHLDNFTLWIAKTLESAIIGALDIDNHEHVEWINDFYRGDPQDCRQPLIVEVAAEVYKHFKNQDQMLATLKRTYLRLLATIKPSDPWRIKNQFTLSDLCDAIATATNRTNQEVQDEFESQALKLSKSL